jgi:hypothetical protein
MSASLQVNKKKTEGANEKFTVGENSKVGENFRVGEYFRAGENL